MPPWSWDSKALLLMVWAWAKEAEKNSVNRIIIFFIGTSFVMLE
jgi:hypothetical protein